MASNEEQGDATDTADTKLEDSPPDHPLYPGSDPTLIALSIVLSDSKKRTALRELEGENAQLMIDFMHSVLLQPEHATSLLLSSTVITLYQLVRKAKLYPQCYVIDGVTLRSQEDSGGICDVYRGSRGDQDLCLKVVRIYRKSETGSALKVFAKEAILWAHLHHPHIIPFYGIYYLDKDQKRLCLVSPWMENGNIVDYLEDNPSLPRLPFIHDIITGLEYLHRNDIVHGDLKGANILVNDSGRACIADFGMSAIRHDKTLSITVTTMASGYTYRWTAPELLNNDEEPTTRASDVWAFGSVCYEILTRQIPFHECSNDAQIMRMVTSGALPTRPPGDAESELDTIDDKMWDLINRCWTQEPEQRPTCRQILEDLDLPISSAKEVDQTDKSIWFQNMVRKDRDLPIDTAKVQQILQDLIHNALL